MQVLLLSPGLPKKKEGISGEIRLLLSSYFCAACWAWRLAAFFRLAAI